MTDLDIRSCPDTKCYNGMIPVDQGEGLARCPLCKDRSKAFEAGNKQGRKYGIKEGMERAAKMLDTNYPLCAKWIRKEIDNER